MAKHNIEVNLVGTNGNAFALIGKVSSAIRRHVGVQAAEDFSNQAMLCSSYDDLLRHIMETVEVK